MQGGEGGGSACGDGVCAAEQKSSAECALLSKRAAPTPACGGGAFGHREGHRADGADLWAEALARERTEVGAHAKGAATEGGADEGQMMRMMMRGRV